MGFSALSAEQMIALRIGLAVCAATLGALLATRLKKVSHLGLCLLISFAAGALLAVALLDILPETVKALGFAKGLISFVSGYLLFWVITRFVFHICPACAATHTEVNFKAITTSMVTALSVHSFMDGLAISSGAACGSSIGVLVLLAVVYHKFPEGMALSLVAVSSGMSRTRALLLSCGIEGITTIAGGVVGSFLPVSEGSPWVGVVLGHVGGGFVFLVIHALLSEVVKHHPRYTILSALAGAASIALVQVLFL